MTRAMTAVPGLTITVHVYDYAQTSPTVLPQAKRQAGRIFSEAGLNVVWLDCATGPAIPDSKDPCQQAMADEDVRLRILTAPVQNFLQDTVLGFAVAPALATVYYESALALAKYDERDFEAPVILGCAIAHEIGHLLLGSNSHSVSGVMCAHWERKHIRLALMGAMLFSPAEAKLVQAEMRRRMTS